MAARLAKGWNVRARAGRRLIDLARSCVPTTSSTHRHSPYGWWRRREPRSTKSWPPGSRRCAARGTADTRRKDRALPGRVGRAGARPRSDGGAAPSRRADPGIRPPAVSRRRSSRPCDLHRRLEDVPGLGGHCLPACRQARRPDPPRRASEPGLRSRRSAPSARPAAGSALMLFALGRTAGWMAHAMEQYALDQLIRPRAAYTGPPPRDGVSAPGRRRRTLESDVLIVESRLTGGRPGCIKASEDLKANHEGTRTQRRMPWFDLRALCGESIGARARAVCPVRKPVWKVLSSPKPN